MVARWQQLKWYEQVGAAIVFVAASPLFAFAAIGAGVLWGADRLQWILSGGARP